MPLIKGHSKKSGSENVRRSMKEGKPQRQAIQGIITSESFNEFFRDKDWDLSFSPFSFEAVWSDEKQQYELTHRDYIKDEDGGLLLKDADGWEILSYIFSEHDLEGYLDNNDMTADELWAQVRPKFQYLKKERGRNND